MNHVSHSRRLRDKIRLARGDMDAAAKALWTHPRSARNLSRVSLPQPCHHSQQRAADAGRGCGCEKRLGSDPIAEGMLAYLRQHIPEETGHDEWVLDDLEVTGINAGGDSEAHTSAVGGGAGRRAILLDPARSPRSVAGLHSRAGREHHRTSSISRIWRIASEFPARAFSNLFLHGKLDPRHREELDHALDAVAPDRSSSCHDGRQRVPDRRLAHPCGRRSCTIGCHNK